MESLQIRTIGTRNRMAARQPFRFNHQFNQHLIKHSTAANRHQARADAPALRTWHA
jgi:hypothetical protein